MKNLLLRSLLLIALIAAWSAAYYPAQANGVLYVTPGGSGGCTSWANACELQTALSNATPGTEIWVTTGVYMPTASTDRGLSFQLKSAVAVYGGFAGTETQRSERDPSTHITILSGDIDHNDSQSPIITNPATVTGNTTNSYHVVSGTTGATLDGFTITAGNANSASGPTGYGGGIYNLIASPNLANLTFSGNSATKEGGGIFNDDSRPILTNVTFAYNAAANGGGMSNSYSNATLLTGTFTNNTATMGGGMYNSYSDPTLSNVTFSNNAAGDAGGGMYNWGSDPTLQAVIFNNNSAYNKGGGIYNTYYSEAKLTNVAFNYNSATYTTANGGALAIIDSSPQLTNVTFNGNWALNNGGAVWWSFSGNGVPKWTNVTFSGNQAYNNGGGMWITNNASNNPVFTNNTFHGNTAIIGGGLFATTFNTQIHNAIFWGNTATISGAQISKNGVNLLALKDSVIQDGCPSGTTCTNILTADPNLGTLGYYGGSTQTIPLLANSSAVDTGNDTTCATTDQRGVLRPQYAHCDIGAYELDITPPVVTAISRVNPNPTFLTFANFTVTFSEPVKGVDASDFSLVTTGIAGAALNAVSGSGSVYNVAVTTGTGSGVLRLDLLDDDTIQDYALNPLGGPGAVNGNFSSGETYDVRIYRAFIPLLSH